MSCGRKEAQVEMFNAFTRGEVRSTYVGEDARFVVSLIVGYTDEELESGDAVGAARARSGASRRLLRRRWS